MLQAIDIQAAVEELTEKLRALEVRIAALEAQPAAASPDLSAVAHAPLQRPTPPATWRGFPSVETPAGVVPVLGKAVLGIAGAYLLRALAESSSIPKLPVLMAAILYACFWIIWAVRTAGEPLRQRHLCDHLRADFVAHVVGDDG